MPNGRFAILLLMKVAILWLVNEKGEVLMARRAAHMSTDANVWGPSVSGKVDPGETFDQAIRREASEELGLTGADVSPIFLHKEMYTDHSDGRSREFGLFYARISSDITKHLKLELNEVAEVRWFTKSELEQLSNAQSESLIISSAKELWQSIFAHLQVIIT